MKTAIAFLLLCSSAAAQGPFVGTLTTHQDGSTMKGSGVCYAVGDRQGVKEIRILSCAHGRNLRDDVTLTFFGNVTIDGAWVSAIDNERDLSLICCTKWPRIRRFYQILPEEYGSPGPGEGVRMVGFGTKYDDKHTEVIGEQVYRGYKYPKIRVKGDGIPGDSGGGLIWKGWLCGITQLRTLGEGMNHDAAFVRSKEIWEFLHAYKVEP